MLKHYIFINFKEFTRMIITYYTTYELHITYLIEILFKKDQIRRIIYIIKDKHVRA